MNQIKFEGQYLLVFESYYQNNNKKAIMLIRWSDNIKKENINYLREYTLSINKDDYSSTNKDCFLLKEYSENKKISEFLIKENYLKKTIKKLKTDFSTHSIIFPEVEMTDKFKKCIININNIK